MNEIVCTEDDDWVFDLLTNPNLVGRFVMFPGWDQPMSGDAFYVHAEYAGVRN